MITFTPDKVERFVGGKMLLIAFGGSVLAAVAVGTVGYFVFHALLGNGWRTTVRQIVTLQVYLVLLFTLPTVSPGHRATNRIVTIKYATRNC
jgi:hypothetical protein